MSGPALAMRHACSCCTYSSSFSLGATLHFALTGAPPFAYEMSAAVLFAHLHEPPPALVGPAPTAADTALEAAVHRALAKDSASRFADGSAMAAALAAVLGAQTFHIGPGRATGTPHPSSAESEAPTREMPPT